jgi:hypothetical protein
MLGSQMEPRGLFPSFYMLFDWIIPMKTIFRGPVCLVFCAILSLGLLASQTLEARTSHQFHYVPRFIPSGPIRYKEVRVHVVRLPQSQHREQRSVATAKVKVNRDLEGLMFNSQPMTSRLIGQP